MSGIRTARLFAALVLLVAITPPAMADVILTAADGGAGFGGPVEGDFAIANTSTVMIYSFNRSDGVYAGLADGAAWTITAADGGAFTLSGLDVDALGWSAGQIDVVLMATPAEGGSPVVASLSSPGTAILPPSLAGIELSSLSISGFGYDDGGGFNVTSGFNNVTVNAVALDNGLDPVTTRDELPEPTTVAVLAVGLAGIGLVRRPRRRG